MTAQAAAEQLPAARREAVTTCPRYLTGHLDQLRYDTALAAGWPIATGARWGLDGAEAVLQLRALITNGDFEHYWRFHAARTPTPLPRFPPAGIQTHRLIASFLADRLQPMEFISGTIGTRINDDVQRQQ